MVDLTHPLVNRDAPCPAAVTAPDGRRYPVASDGTVSVPDAVADTLVESWVARYGVATATCYPAATCETIKSDGEMCGRDLPCPYHSGTDVDSDASDADDDSEA